MIHKLSDKIISKINGFAIVSITDINGIITYVNDRFIEAYGYSYDEVIGQKHSLLNSNFHKKKYFKELWNTISRGDNFHGLNRNRTKYGEILWVDVHIYPLPDDNEKESCFFSVNYPVSELRTDDKHWRETSILKAVLNDFLTTAVNITNYDTLFESATNSILSSSFSKLLLSAGIFLVEDDNFVLKYHSNLSPEIILKCSNTKVSQCQSTSSLETKVDTSISMNISFAQGTKKEQNIDNLGRYNTPIIHQGKVVGLLVVVVSDVKKITETRIEFIEVMANALAITIDRLKKSQQIKKEKLIAENSLRSKTKYLNVISHEIRTPLNGIVGISNLLEVGNITDENEMKSMIKTLSYSANNLMRLVNDVLDYAKLEAGKMELENVDFNLSNFTDEIEHTLSIECNKKGISFTVEKDEKIPTTIKGDSVRLNQVILNISNNAIKFTDKGHVRLVLSTKKINKSHITIRFEIIDTGIGIAKENITKVFKQFEQAETSTTRKYGGTGLGLSIAKQIIELQNSEIKIKSELGKGSTFYFDLKFDLTKQNKSVAKFDSTKANLNNIKILLAEDNPINTLVVKKFLSMWNTKVTSVSDGKEALKVVENNTFDIILMDVHMPIIDGIEAANKIREKDKNIPIIALTASMSSKKKFLEEHKQFDDFVTKPFLPELFFETIRKYTKYN